MNFRLFSFIFATLALSGCLSQLEKDTAETKGEVRKSNEEIEKSTLGTALTNALKSVDDAKEIADRVAAAENIFTTNARLTDTDEPWYEVRLHIFLGGRLPVKIHQNTLDVTHDPLPNVSVVSDEGVKSLDVRNGYAPISSNRLAVLETASSKMLTDLLTIGKKPDVSEKWIETYREKVVRLVYVATMVFGARPLDDLKAFYRDLYPHKTALKTRAGKETVYTGAQLRSEIKDKLVRAAAMYDLEKQRPETFQDLKTLLNVRMHENF